MPTNIIILKNMFQLNKMRIYLSLSMLCNDSSVLNNEQNIQKGNPYINCMIVEF